MKKNQNICRFAALALGTLPALAIADPVPLFANATIIDKAPFYSVGGEDSVGFFNYALNFPTFIDIPYAIFDFGTTTSVGNAMLTWNFDALFGGSGPAEIELYVGTDSDGVITTGDRFEGTMFDTFTYSGGELRTYDVTAAVNAALGIGRYFMARLEVTADPSLLSDYHGGLFMDPSMTMSPVPEPASWAALGLGFAAALRRRARKS